MNKTNAPGKSIISASGVQKSFDNGRISVLRGVNLTINKGEIVALWGGSGSGKTTLLHLLGGLDIPDAGTLTVAGLNPAKKCDRLQLRREKVGFIFQLHNLIADLTLRENCLLTAVATGGKKKEYRSRFDELTAILGINHLQNQRIQELSGGERQRIAVCRALMHRPEVILADEPTGSLDEDTGAAVFQILKEMAKQENVTVVMATHERRYAESCDRIIQICKGNAKNMTLANKA